MSLCNTHYYSHSDPIGLDGDFITAPEISSLFGETVALWLYSVWEKRSKPALMDILELGGGYGTLMADVLRALRRLIPQGAFHIHMVENSTPLRKRQGNALQAENVTFYETMGQLPENSYFGIANEFFDALPVEQYRKTNMGYDQRGITCAGGKFAWAARPVCPPSPLLQSNGWCDRGPARTAAFKAFTDKCQAFLIIDYGYMEGEGDTVQAVKEHRYSDALSNPGAQDITAHVNFKDLISALAPEWRHTYTNQGAFLENYGIKTRVNQIFSHLSSEKQISLLQAVHRLSDKEEMGYIFKVLEGVRQ